MTQPDDEQIATFSETYFRNKFRKIHNIYIDLEVLQDFRFGALLLAIKGEKAFNYVRDQIPTYNARYDECTMKYFPAITYITDEMLDSIIADTSKHTVLARLSPWTTQYDILDETIASINAHNKHCEMGEGRITIRIGTSGVKYVPETKDNLRRAIQARIPNVDVVILDRNMTELDEATFVSTDMFITKDQKFFHDEHLVGKQLSSEDDPFRLRVVLSYPIIEIAHSDDITPEELLSNTHAALQMFCSFDYIERGLAL